VVRGGDSVLPGRVWSGNQRQIGGAALARLGDGGYATAPRAAQIRDGLAAISRATPRDLLAVQLDDRALFLQPWHERLLATLSPAALQGQPARAELRRHAEKWEGRASVEAVSYRIVREFRQAVRARVFGPIFAPCLETMPEFSWRRFHLEPALQAMLREQPLHLLDPGFQSWDDLLVAAVDDTIAAIAKSGLPLPGGTWGERNRARIRHPFSNAFPLVGRWLDLPADPLPGDTDLPRVQSPSNGASQRLVVSPGREEEGLFHMPGGQSGHPLSPFFRAGHQAWVRGEPTPLLPGPARHRLTLQP
jgi:penicillin amidase